ncbi:MAG: SDR family NAD(P)-dependent oxidoreductase [Planctomycetota bacterium]|jgi:NAD(P)-dependent dehydrogenase (short-subunit alcohol dehydrogenase family)
MSVVKIDLSGKRALVTGASRGIGAAVARSLCEAGARVFAGYRKSADVPWGEAFHCDHDSPDLPPGPLDILVNNAGIWIPTPVDAESWDRDWQAVLQTNLTAVADLCRRFAKQVEAKDACIVNITSRASHRGEAGYSAYAASKAAVNALTKSLAAELGPRAIRVNAIAPGWVRTDMTAAALEKTPLPEPIPLGRVGEPEDVAGPVLFLCSDMARYLTGVVLDVCGGAYLH